MFKIIAAIAALHNFVIRAESWLADLKERVVCAVLSATTERIAAARTDRSNVHRAGESRLVGIGKELSDDIALAYRAHSDKLTQHGRQVEAAIDAHNVNIIALRAKREALRGILKDVA